MESVAEAQRGAIPRVAYVSTLEWWKGHFPELMAVERREPSKWRHCHRLVKDGDSAWRVERHIFGRGTMYVTSAVTRELALDCLAMFRAAVASNRGRGCATAQDRGAA